MNCNFIALAKQLLAWLAMLFGLHADIFNMYCLILLVRKARCPMSAIPLVGLLSYLVAESLGFPHKKLLLALCISHILIMISVFIYTRIHMK